MQQIYRTKATATSEKKDVYSVVTNRIIELLEKGVVPWKPCVRDRGDVLSLPVNGYSGHRYQGVNVLVLMGTALDQGYTSNRWYTMAQVNKIGARVQKGQKGTPIIFAKYIDKKDFSGKVVLDKHGNPEQRYFLTYTYGWNLNQTTLEIENGEEEHLDPALRQGAANDLIMAYVLREGIEVTEIGNKPTYDWVRDQVNLPDFRNAISAARWFESAFHELTHSTGHMSRLKRFEKGCRMGMDSPERAREELLAELGAAYLMAEHGIFDEQEQNLTDYIRGWLTALQDDKRMIFQASTKAQAAVAYIKLGAA